MASISPQGNTPPADFNHRDLAREVRNHIFQKGLVERKTELPLTFSAACPGADRRSIDSWVDLNLHHGLDCTKTLMFANWTRSAVEELEAIFADLKGKISEADLGAKFEKALKRVSQFSKEAAVSADSMRTQVRTLLLDIMNRTGIRPMDEEIQLDGNPA